VAQRGTRIISRTFQHRSSRVIALGRLVLASFFLLAVLLDPAHPKTATEATYGLLASYFVASLSFLVVTWSNWRAEARLAGPAHVVDLLFFAFLISSTDGYQSPFFTFFVFLVLSATIRWGWRETAATGAAVMFVYAAAGISADTWGTDSFDVRRFLVRGSFLAVLSLILIWFDVNQRAILSHMAKGEGLLASGLANRPSSEIARYAAERFAAGRAICVWWRSEDPGLNVTLVTREETTEVPLPSDQIGSLIAPGLEGRPIIFDLSRKRILLFEGGQRKFRRHQSPISSSFADHFGIKEGLLIRVTENVIGCEIILQQIPGLCSDDLRLAEQVQSEIEAALERLKLQSFLEAAAATSERLTLARDLHDSVLQLLAGMSYKLQAIKRTADPETAVGQMIGSVQKELSQEQKELRGLIEQLRGGRGPARLTNMSAPLAALVDRASRQWDVGCFFRSSPAEVEAPAALQHEVNQLIREAIANAVRHGGANEVLVSLRKVDDWLNLEISDNGGGFPAKQGSKVGEHSPAPKPWSLYERTRDLGGTLTVYSGRQGSRVSISIPAKVPQ
jgi:signal transduction histidine kinase